MVESNAIGECYYDWTELAACDVDVVMEWASRVPDGGEIGGRLSCHRPVVAEREP